MASCRATCDARTISLRALQPCNDAPEEEGSELCVVSRRIWARVPLKTPSQVDIRTDGRALTHGLHSIYSWRVQGLQPIYTRV